MLSSYFVYSTYLLNLFTYLGRLRRSNSVEELSPDTVRDDRNGGSSFHYQFPTGGGGGGVLRTSSGVSVPHSYQMVSSNYSGMDIITSHNPNRLPMSFGATRGATGAGMPF